MQDRKTYYYKIYQEEEIKAAEIKTLYQKLAKKAGKILRIEPDEKTKQILQEAIDFAHLNITPSDAVSFSILLFLILGVVGIALFFLNIFSLVSLMLYFLAVTLLTYYYYYYPVRLKKIYELKAGSELVMMILHMVIYMRNFPNLEGAVKFASENLSGPLALDLRKLLWDVENAVYNSMEEALLNFSLKWRKDFRELSDAINAIIYSLYTSGERRIAMLNESVKIILDGIKERSEQYALKLKSPIEMVNALGILLPTLTLTMLPIISIFLGDIVSVKVLIAGYNLLLPMFLIFIIKNILDERVITLPQPDISLHPNLPKKGCFRLYNLEIPSILVSILIAIPFLAYGYSVLESMNIYQSLVISFGIFLSVSSYFYLNSFQKVKIRNDILKLEEEFRELLFALGQEIKRGIPLESAIEKVIPTLRGTSSKNFLSKIVDNIKFRGYSLREAVFGKEGAIHNYPSKLIHSIVRAIVDAAEKGTEIISRIMLSISKYLEDMHKLQNEIEEKFSEIVGSMSMQAKILIPFLCGIMNVLAYMMIKVITQIGATMKSLPITNQAAVPYASFLASLWQSLSITPASFQIVMGIYALEAIAILSWFINGIIVGEDEISLHYTIGKNLMFGGILYILITLIGLVTIAPFALSITTLIK